MNRPRRSSTTGHQKLAPSSSPRVSLFEGCCPSVEIGILPVDKSDETLKRSSGVTRPSRWTEWKEHLLKISNIASILCVIDCTVLPAVTLFLPLIGVAASAEQTKWLHDLGHSIALYFVLPVGGLAATMNYLTHKRAQLPALAAVGLILIYAANGHGGPILSRLPHELGS